MCQVQQGFQSNQQNKFHQIKTKNVIKKNCEILFCFFNKIKLKESTSCLKAMFKIKIFFAWCINTIFKFIFSFCSDSALGAASPEISIA